MTYRIKIFGETDSRMLVLNPSPYDFCYISTPHIISIAKGERPRVVCSMPLKELYLEKEELEGMEVYREIDVPVYSADVYEPSDPCFTARSVEYFAIEVSPVVRNDETSILKKFAESILRNIVEKRDVYKSIESAIKSMITYIMIPRNALIAISVPETKQRGPVTWREGTLKVAPVHPSLYVVGIVMETRPFCGPDGYALHAVKISIFKNGEKILETSKSFSA